LLEAPGNGGVGVFAPLHFEGDIAGVTGIPKEAGDSGVIEVQGVPLSSALIGFGLDEDGFRGDLREFVVGIFKEVAGIHEGAQPRGREGVEDSEQALRGAGEAPVVFEAEQDAALGGFGEARLDAVDAPLETLVLGMTWEDGFLAAGFHELIERADGVPASGVEADAGDAEFVGDFDAFMGVFDLLPAVFGVGVDEILMDREADEVDALAEGVAFKCLQVGSMFAGEGSLFGDIHLTVEDIDAFDAEGSCLVDDGFDGDPCRAEVPVGVGGDSEFEALGRWGVGCGAGDGGQGEGGGGQAGIAEEGATIDFHRQHTGRPDSSVQFKAGSMGSDGGGCHELAFVWGWAHARRPFDNDRRSCRMSTTPEPEMDLELHFLPAWARQSPEVNRYADYTGGVERRSGGRGAREGYRGDRPARRDARPGAGRDGGGGDRGRGGPRRGDRGPVRAGGGGGRDWDRGGRGAAREAPVVLPDVGVAFTPEPRGVESLARQIKLTGRAYPVFEIGHLILSKPDRYHVTFSTVKRSDGTVAQALWLCSIDDTLWFSQDDAIGHVLRKHFDLFYQAERTPAEPPKGTYTFVAQCGLSGTILGPPNYHDYQTKLRRLHASRFSRMPFEAFKAKVRIVRDEATVKQWVEEQSWRAEFICLNVPDALKLANREEAEKHFREVHVANLVRSVETWTGLGTAAQQQANGTLRQLLRRAWDEQHRFPLRLVTVLSQQFAGHGLQFFKVNKTVTHVCVARPHFLDIDAEPVSEGVRKIVEYVRVHEGCTRRQLMEALAPVVSQAVGEAVAPAGTQLEGGAGGEGAGSAVADRADAGSAGGSGMGSAGAPADPVKRPELTPQQAVVGADLHWLIHQGHVIEFANGRLETAKKPKPRPVRAVPEAGADVPSGAPEGGAQLVGTDASPGAGGGEAGEASSVEPPGAVETGGVEGGSSEVEGGDDTGSDPVSESSGGEGTRESGVLEDPGSTRNPA
jgi:hypothetical protein